MIAIAVFVWLTGIHFHSFEEEWLGCKTTVRCDGDVCLVRFYCP